MTSCSHPRELWTRHDDLGALTPSGVVRCGRCGEEFEWAGTVHHTDWHPPRGTRPNSISLALARWPWLRVVDREEVDAHLLGEIDDWDHQSDVDEVLQVWALAAVHAIAERDGRAFRPADAGLRYDLMAHPWLILFDLETIRTFRAEVSATPEPGRASVLDAWKRHVTTLAAEAATALEFDELLQDPRFAEAVRRISGDGRAPGAHVESFDRRDHVSAAPGEDWDPED